ncbi:MAG: TonB-dependent siderophore receptor [Acidovorax sp.]
MPINEPRAPHCTSINKPFPRQPVAQAAAVVACGLALYAALPQPALAQAQQTQATQQTYRIAAGALAPALRSLASSANLLLTFTEQQTAGKTTAGINGPYTPQAALAALLAGTGLQAVALDNGGYVLRAVPVVSAPASSQTGEMALPTVTVRSSAIEETATGPVDGYVAKRSATGTKTDTPIIEIPQSISVVGAEEITTLKSQSIQDALGYVAGVARTEGLDRTTASSLFLRGFQNSALYRDGSMYTVNIYDGQVELYGLERLELLKGASSVLYGANAPGGIINMVTKRPTVEPIHELNVEVGSFGRKQISGDFGGKLDKDGEWSYRLTALTRDSNTFVDYVPDDRTYIAPSIKWQPNAGTSLTLLAEYQKDHTAYVYGLPAEGTVLPNINGQIPRNRFVGEPGHDKFDTERYSIGYIFEYAFNDSLKLRHSLRYFHSNNNYPNIWIWGLAADQRTTSYRGGQDRLDTSRAVASDTSLQYQVKTGAIEHTAIVGFDYSLPKHETLRYNFSVPNIDIYNPVYTGTQATRTPATASDWWRFKRLGLYVQDQMKIADKLVLSLGGRYDSVTYDETYPITGASVASGEKSHAFTGRAGLVYLFDNGIAPFVSYSESFEPTAGRDRNGNRFEPTTGQQYEAGVRYQPKGSDTTLSAAVYQLTRKNLTTTDPIDINYQIQSGKVRSRGVELEARTRIGRNANVIAAYAYTDARTIEAGPLNPGDVGQRTRGVPYNQFSLWSDYSFGEFGLPGLKAGAGVRYVGSTRGIATGTAVNVPSYLLFDAMLSYTNGPWKFALNATNLTNKTYVASCALYACFYGEPRKIIGTATYRW